MKYYQDITLLPDAEVPVHFLLSKVFMQIHIAFVEEKNKSGMMQYAVSFPEYGETSLGNKIRIFSIDRNELEKLDIRTKLSRFSDYVHVTSIRDIPERITSYEIFSRYQVDGSVHQKAKRYVSRHPGISYEEATRLLRQKNGKTKLPYVQMLSLSNSNRFRLFVKRTVVDVPLHIECGTYGLSDECTVPKLP